MSTPVEVSIMPVPIQGCLGCLVPVVPGTPDTDAPMEQRTELCASDAHWVVGMVPTCDTHMEVFCEAAGIDWPGVWQEAGRHPDQVGRPWSERLRHSQEDAREHHARFLGEEER